MMSMSLKRTVRERFLEIPIQAAALGEVFGHRSTGQRVWLGSAKSNIGHARAAAGVAGVIKMLLSLEHETIPQNAPRR